MHLNKSLLCFCCIVTFCCCLAASSTQNVHNARKKDITETTQSNIYKVKRLDKEQVSKRIKSIKNKIKEQHNNEALPPSLPYPVISPSSSSATASTEAMTMPQHVKKTRTKKLKNSHGQNRKLLSKLGFTKVKAPNSHNRKRLAIESRRHASPDDSHMFIIKLPPSANYYSSPKANEGANSGSSLQNSIQTFSKEHGKEQKIAETAAAANSIATAAATDNGKKVSFPFNSNGRPGRIYHWNLPILQKILDDKQRFANVPKAMKHQLIDIKDTPTWSKPWENDTIEKSWHAAAVQGKSHHREPHHHYQHQHSHSSYKKSLKRKSPTYYAPANNVNKNSFHKYFAGNGKPKGFYVIKENEKKPLYYKNIVS